ncbi:hypothetical protein [Neobacillus vireti]|uniref:hypothetical protein n=1 Tax=Neobacillus vireti TaxID=220686 RepID=UPI002FFF6B26
MSTIKVNLTGIQQTIPEVHTCSNKLSNIKNQLTGLKSGIDTRIINRRGIGARLNHTVQATNELEMKLKALENFLRISIEKYVQAEQIIERKSQSLQGADSKAATTIGIHLALGNSTFRSNNGLSALGLGTFQNAALFRGAPAWSTSINGKFPSVSKNADISWGQLLLKKWNQAVGETTNAWTRGTNYIGNQATHAWNRSTNYIENQAGDAWNYVETKRKQMITTYEFAKDNKTDIFNALLETGVRKTLDITPSGQDFRERLEYFHYEQRKEMNGPPPIYEEVKDPASGWIRLPVEMSIYHDNNQGEPELKFIHPDGREAVFNGDDHSLVTDPRYIGTYNYINPSLQPEGFPTNKEELLEWIEFGKTGIGHVATDVVPYYMVGQKNERDQQRFLND